MSFLTTRNLLKFNTLAAWSFGAQFVGASHWYLEHFGYTKGSNLDGAASVGRLMGAIIFVLSPSH
jgi:hypothetical protein